MGCQRVTMNTEEEKTGVEFGQGVYAEDGTHLGAVRGFDDAGFYVTATDNVGLPDQGEKSIHAEALMWRCWECGEMGKLGEIPEECPNCGAPKEEIYYWQED